MTSKFANRSVRVMQSDLELEELQTNLFKAPEDKLYKGGVGIFGGQLLAHALGAASAAMPDGFDVNSLHCYFMRSARVAPTLYQVTPERVGRSYATCSVEGLQDGKAVIKCLLSFHRPEVSSSEHQLPMPMYPTPEELLSPEAAKRFAEAFSDMSPERRDLLKRYQDRAAIEVLFVIPHNDSGKAARPARQQTWMRSRTRLPDDSSVHCAALAYMSDYHSLFIATMPHPEMRARLKLITSLDHSLWFHGRPFRADEWLLFEVTSPTLANCRGFVEGRVWTRGGDLVATLSQEGLIRADQGQAARSKL